MSEAEQPAANAPLPGGNFQMFITKQSIQGLLYLGLIENPVTKQTEINLDFAKSLIDDLDMLREKTQGNLTDDETAHLSKIISDLQFHFVEKTKSEGEAPPTAGE